jgi:hypothetical protein
VILEGILVKRSEVSVSMNFPNRIPRSQKLRSEESSVQAQFGPFWATSSREGTTDPIARYFKRQSSRLVGVPGPGMRLSRECTPKWSPKSTSGQRISRTESDHLDSDKGRRELAILSRPLSSQSPGCPPRPSTALSLHTGRTLLPKMHHGSRRHAVQLKRTVEDLFSMHRREYLLR